MKRIGTLMKLKPGAAEEYIRLHHNIWPEVVKAGHNAHMHNYTIFKIGDYLFSYYEYTGEDFEQDMQEKNSLHISIEWQKATGLLREAIEGDSKVMTIEEIWHEDF